jgi:hypothetical protein
MDSMSLKTLRREKDSKRTEEIALIQAGAIMGNVI